MRAKLAQINRKVQALRSRLGLVRLARLPKQLQSYAATGERPNDELANAYLDLTNAALTIINASVGAENCKQAVDAYDVALGRCLKDFDKIRSGLP